MSESANEGHFGEEVALLISSAKAKNIDVSVWLTEGGDDGKIIFPDFSSKLISLGLIVAMGEDGDNKSKLDYATSELSLNSILKICQRGEDSLGVALIDVSQFLQIVDKNLLLNTRTQFSDDMVGVRTSLSDYPLNDSVELHYLDTDKCTSNDDRYSTRDIGDDRYDDANIKITVDDDFLVQDNALSGEGITRGDEGGEIKGDRYSQEYFEELKNANQWRPQVNTNPAPPSMAALFDADDKHEPISPIVMKELEPSAPVAISARNKPKAIPSSQRITPSSSASESRRSSTPGSGVARSSESRRSSTPGSGVARSVSRTPAVTSSRSSIGNNDSLISHNTFTKEELLELQIRDQRVIVEDHVRNAVRQTDLYHLIQVHLGFIDSYTMIPPRGVIVSSKPRPWLTVRDIQTAFMAGRVRLNDLQVYAFSELVNLFSKEYKDAHKNQPILDLSSIGDLNNDKENENFEGILPPQRSLSPDPSARSNTPTKRDLSCPAHQMPITALPKHAVAPGHKINAEWLKRYLVHLRLTKRPSNLAADNRAATASTVFASQTITRSRRSLSISGSGSKSMDCSRSSTPGGPDRRPLGGDDGDEQRPVPWLDWLSEKVKNDRSMSEGKPKEFRRALTGKPHSLSKQDLNRILEGNEIIPEKILHAEVTHRAHSWVLDTSGRRDFSHLLNIEMRKWEMKRKMDRKVQVEKGEKISPITKEQRESAKSDIKKDLIALKTTELLSAERTHVFITKEVIILYH
jgi:hypothetical protein